MPLSVNGWLNRALMTDGGAVITFQPDDSLDAEVGRLTAQGVDFPGGISEHPWGRIASFKDTEGNDLQLYAPPQ